jgi:hypothetical protein
MRVRRLGIAVLVKLADPVAERCIPGSSEREIGATKQ